MAFLLGPIPAACWPHEIMCSHNLPAKLGVWWYRQHMARTCGLFPAPSPSHCAILKDPPILG